MAHLSGADSTLLRLRFEQIARPLFVFGGGMAAAWGMRRAAEQVQALALPPHIVSWLRVAGIAFGIYAIFGGLFIPLQPPQRGKLSFDLGHPRGPASLAGHRHPRMVDDSSPQYFPP